MKNSPKVSNYFLTFFQFIQLDNSNIIIRVAISDDIYYAIAITTEMEDSARARGTGIAKRSPAYVESKIQEGKAVITVICNW